MNKKATEHIFNEIYQVIENKDWFQDDLKEAISNISLDDILLHYELDEILEDYNAKDIISALDDDDLILHLYSSYSQKQLMQDFDIEFDHEIEDRDIYNIFKPDVINKINEISEKNNFLNLLNYLNKYEI